MLIGCPFPVGSLQKLKLKPRQVKLRLKSVMLLDWPDGGRLELSPLSKSQDHEAFYGSLSSRIGGEDTRHDTSTICYLNKTRTMTTPTDMQS